MAEYFIAYDCEIVETIQPGSSLWETPWMLHPSVVCTIDSQNKRRHFLGEEATEMQELLRLFSYYETIVDFNGVTFDCMVLDGALSMKPGSVNQILKGKHVDIMAHIKQVLGKRVSLDSLARGMGLSKSGHGALAPQMWRSGMRKEVIEYCYNDVDITRWVYIAGREKGRVPVLYKTELTWVPVPVWKRV